MERGYVRLYRKKLDSDLWQYPHADRVFEFLMLSATYRPHKYFAYGTCIDLLPGQYISSDRVIAKKCRIGYQSVRTAIKYLKSTQRIAQKVTHHYSIYSVLNWSSYQNTESTTNAGYIAPTNAELTHSQRSTNAALTQKQEVKKLKKDQNPVAVKLYDFYAQNVHNDPAKRSDAIRNITKLLSKGHTEADLAGAVEEYANSGPGDKPFHANNFFGMKEYYKGFGKYRKESA